jgi:NAD(P)-dependent dehydrogenase (short-subunit alcohol dehydrogenase family)
MNTENPPKTVLVSGATGAIGRAIASQLAKAGLRVVIAARNEEKAQKITAEIIRTSGNEQVEYRLCDLSRRADIYKLADEWRGPLHILVNNAAISPRTRQETPEGIERQFATNVLGYYWMMDAFCAILERFAPARVVNVASYWAGGLDLSDPEFKRRKYDNNQAYRQSKQADRMLTAAFARRMRCERVTVNACHPGDVRSQLSSDLGFGGHETPDQGAETPVFLALSPTLEGLSGKYFEHKQEVRCSFSQNHQAVEELYELCSRYQR